MCSEVSFAYNVYSYIYTYLLVFSACRSPQHYRAGLNMIPVMEGFQYNPDDRLLLDIAVGSQAGQLANIDANGAVSMGFHSFPFVLEYDPHSGVC